MMENIFNIKDLSKRMDGAVSALKNEFSGLRTGRASASLLDPISVDVYGSKMPLNQLGTVSVPDARTKSIAETAQAMAAMARQHQGAPQQEDSPTPRLRGNTATRIPCKHTYERVDGPQPSHATHQQDT